MSKRTTFVCALLAALLLLSAFPLAAAAEGNAAIDMDKKGSIQVILVAGEKPIQDAELRIYRVADIGITGYNYSYSYVPEFAACGVDIAAIFAAETPLKLSRFVEEESLVGKTAMTDKKGVAEFGGMSVGVYLVVNTDYLNDYMSIQPFIAQVPVMSEDGAVWVYDINAKPKMQTTESCPKRITVKKVWNDKSDSAKKRPDGVKVGLYRSGELFDTAFLSDKNGWSHTFENLPIEFVWSVKEEGELPEGYTAEVKRSDTYNFVVTNTYKEKLPQTGQLNWPVPVLAFAGVVLIGLGLLLWRKKKA